MFARVNKAIRRNTNICLACADIICDEDLGGTFKCSYSNCTEKQTHCLHKESERCEEVSARIYQRLNDRPALEVILNMWHEHIDSLSLTKKERNSLYTDVKTCGNYFCFSCKTAFVVDKAYYLCVCGKSYHLQCPEVNEEEGEDEEEGEKEPDIEQQQVHESGDDSDELTMSGLV